jgi:hypothetical protein|tara:strand:+ start:6968 stop:7186 length:219 start_codon:yes stop_codon:yes gene_type:complete
MITEKLQTLSKLHNCMVEEELLQNQEKPLSLENAQEIDPVAALRWRWRICRVSGKVFDITKEGLFYTCGEYA